MANTRGATHIHGPAATGTIKAGNIVAAKAAPSVGPGSGANSGHTTTVGSGKVSSGFGSPISGAQKAVNAGNKTTVGAGTKQPLSGGPSAKGVGAATPYRRKKARSLGTGGEPRRPLLRKNLADRPPDEAAGRVPGKFCGPPIDIEEAPPGVQHERCI